MVRAGCWEKAEACQHLEYNLTPGATKYLTNKKYLSATQKVVLAADVSCLLSSAQPQRKHSPDTLERRII